MCSSPLEVESPSQLHRAAADPLSCEAWSPLWLSLEHIQSFEIGASASLRKTLTFADRQYTYLVGGGEGGQHRFGPIQVATGAQAKTAHPQIT